MKSRKIVIVGAGPGGLTAGMILARRGFDPDAINGVLGRLANGSSESASF